MINEPEILEDYNLSREKEIPELIRLKSKIKFQENESQQEELEPKGSSD